MAARSLCLAALCLFTAAPLVQGTHARLSPIRRVVNMLQVMQKKQELEGVKQEKLFDKFMCNCKENQEKLGQSISDAEDRIPNLEASVQELTSQKEQLESDLESQKSDRENARATLEQSTAMRSKEKAGFETDSADSMANINSIGKAIDALEKGVSEDSFLQTPAGNRFATLMEADRLPVQSLSKYDRDTVVAFLQHGTAGGSTEEIIGILKNMKEDMEKDLATMQQGEADAITAFAALTEAKNKEVAAATIAIEDKTGRLGETQVQLVEAKHDLDSTKTNLAADQELLATYVKECKQRQIDYNLLKKTMGAEAVALADTVKMLNDDEAQALFRKTLPTQSGAASFLQITSSSSSTDAEDDASMDQAVAAVQRTAGSVVGNSGLAALAIKARNVAKHKGRGKKAGFDKVISLINGMIVLLKKNQEDDDLKKTMCNTEINNAEDRKTELEEQEKAKQAAAEDAASNMDTTSKEIADLTAAIIELDKSVQAAEKQRQTENTDYLELLAENGAAIELLKMAENRMNKFYNPEQYEGPGAALAQMSAPQGDVAVQSSGFSVAAQSTAAEAPSFIQEESQDGDSDEFGFFGQSSEGSAPAQADTSAVAPADNSDGASALQVVLPEVNIENPNSDDVVAQTPPPTAEQAETSAQEAPSADGEDTYGFFSAVQQQHKQQSAKSNAVIQLIRDIQGELKTEIQSAKHEEQDSQANYEELMTMSASKRQADAKTITQKSGVHADLKETLAMTHEQIRLTKQEHDQTIVMIFQLHQDCDWLMKNFDVVKAAREGEMEALRKASAVLHGADLSFAQSRQKRVRR